MRCDHPHDTNARCVDIFSYVLFVKCVSSNSENSHTQYLYARARTYTNECLHEDAQIHAQRGGDRPKCVSKCSCKLQCASIKGVSNVTQMCVNTQLYAITHRSNQTPTKQEQLIESVPTRCHTHTHQERFISKEISACSTGVCEES